MTEQQVSEPHWLHGWENKRRSVEVWSYINPRWDANLGKNPNNKAWACQHFLWDDDGQGQEAEGRRHVT